MPDELPLDVMKAALKEATAEWLDKKFAELGKWTLRGLAAALFSVIVGALLHVSAK